jgi:hypothetical protein
MKKYLTSFIGMARKINGIAINEFLQNYLWMSLVAKFLKFCRLYSLCSRPQRRPEGKIGSWEMDDSLKPV